MDNQEKSTSHFSSLKSHTNSPASASPNGSEVALEQSYSEHTSSQVGMPKKSQHGASPPERDEDEPRSRSSTLSSDSRDASPSQRQLKSSDSDEQMIVYNSMTVKRKKSGGRQGHYIKKSSKQFITIAIVNM